MYSSSSVIDCYICLLYTAIKAEEEAVAKATEDKKKEAKGKAKAQVKK